MNQNNKLDNLMKLGLGFIFLSGIIFATTSWDVIDDYVKLLLLIFFGGVSFVLSVFTDKKLGLPKSSFMYWILSIICFFVFIVGVGYFEVLGDWFSFNGDGCNILFSILALYIGVALIFAEIKSKNIKFLSLSWFFHYMAIVCVLNHFEVGFLNSLIVLSMLLSACRFIKFDSKKYLVNFNYTLNIYMSLFAFVFFYNRLYDMGDIVYYVLGCLTYIGNIMYMFIKKDDNNYGFLLTITSLFVIIRSSWNRELSGVYVSMFLLYLFSILFYFLFNKRKNFININMIFYNILICIFTFLLSFEDMDVMKYVFISLFIIYHLVFSLVIKDNNELYFRPFKLLILLVYVCELFDVNTSLSSIIVIVIMGIYCVLCKNKVNQITSLFTFNIPFLLGLFLVCFSKLLDDIITFSVADMNYYDFILYFVVLIFSLVNLIALCKNFNFNKRPIFVIYYVLVSFIININVFNLQHFIPYVISGVFTFIVCILGRKFNSNIKDWLTYLCVLIVWSCLSEFTMEIILLIAGSYIIIYGLVCRYLLKDKKYSNVLFNISIFLLFFSNIIGSIVMWSLIVYLLFINYEEHKNSDVYLVILFISIFIRLSQLWEDIPLWFFFFMIGVIIIGFVTRRELKKKNESNKEVSNVNIQPVINNQEKKEALFCYTCGSRLTGNKVFCSNCGRKCN